MRAWISPPPLAPPDPRRWVEHDVEHWQRLGWGPWAVEVDGTYAGRAGLVESDTPRPDVVELDWALLPAHWGRGIATAAARAAVAWARELELTDVVSFTLVGNAASRRVMEKAGLRYVRDFEHAGFPHALYELDPPLPGGRGLRG